MPPTDLLTARTGGDPGETIVGVGGIGWGRVFALASDRTLGRNESRAATLLPAEDYFKLHIVFHTLTLLVGAAARNHPRIMPIGLVGRDDAGRRLVRLMQDVGMDVGFVRQAADHPTAFGIASRYPDGSGFTIDAINGACAALGPDAVRRIIRTLRPAIAVALPEVAIATRGAFLEGFDPNLTRRVASFTSAEMASPSVRDLVRHLDLLAANEDEAGALIRRNYLPAETLPFLSALERRVGQLNPATSLVFTAGAVGAFAYENGRWDHCPVPSVRVASTAGAGDTLLAGILAGLWAGFPLSAPDRSGAPFAERAMASALDVGVLAASYKVGSMDTIPAGASAIRIRDFGRGLGLDLPGRQWLDPQRAQHSGGPGR